MARPLEDLHSSFEFSSYRESVLEQLFCAEILQAAWIAGYPVIEVSRPFVDFQGYDLEISAGPITRHVQLKATAGRIAVHRALADKPSACLINLRPRVVEDRTAFTYDFFGAEPGDRIDLTDFKAAKKNTNSRQDDGSFAKNERPNHVVVPASAFVKGLDIDALLVHLFGEPPSADQADQGGLTAGSQDEEESP